MTEENGAPRRGRPSGTSARALELTALDLFTRQGFDETTVEQIAHAAGVSKRTFFRYFESKTDVLWHEFDTEVDQLRTAFAAADPNAPLLEAIRAVVISVNHYGASDVAELRARMNLIAEVPALQASAALHYDRWESAVADYAAARTGEPADSLFPLSLARATLAVCRAAFDRWAQRGDADLTVYLDAALRALAAGFSGCAVEPGPARGVTRKSDR